MGVAGTLLDASKTPPPATAVVGVMIAAVEVDEAEEATGAVDDVDGTV